MSHQVKRNKERKLHSAVRELFPFERHYCDVDNGKSLCYVDVGTGPVLLFIHACPMYSFEFRLAIFEFSKHFRVIAYDQMGFGFSDIPSSYDYRIGNHVAQLTRFLRELNIRNGITLIMHGRGAAIGMGFAVRHPEMIQAAVVMNAPSFSDFHLAYRLSLFRLVGLRSFCFPLLTFILRPPTRLMPGVREAYKIALSRKSKVPFFHFIESLPRAPEDNSAQFMIEIETGLWFLRRTDIPVLLLWGDRDWLYDERDLNKWKKYFPNAQCHVIQHAGRYLTEDAPHEILRYLSEFLNQIHPITKGNNIYDTTTNPAGN